MAKINRDKEALLDHTLLVDKLIYDPETGVFTHRYSRIGVRGGSIAGTNVRGYISIRINGIAYQAHRLAWFYVYKEWPKNYIDHIDGDKTNNAINNLRDSSHSDNLKNRGVQANNKLGVKGVIFVNGKYRAEININGKKILLGNFSTLEEASNKYIETAKEHFGIYYKEQPNGF